ncbi:MAG: glycerate-2-kinase family protein [Candidatus Marinimicrobia bacterium]|nr:glycerate-2-kinase family protein [Candidatus Neomarinimicrobiota bacterium]
MFSPGKKFLKDVYLQSLSAVQPSALFGKYLHRFENKLYYHNSLVPAAADGKTVLAGSGKASVNMAKAVLGYVSVKPENTLLISPFLNTGEKFRVLPGDHPLPGRNSCRAGKTMAKLMNDLEPGDLVYYVLSGGSSSLLEYPAEGISIEDIQKANKVFLASGLTIHEINFLRTRLSRIKGGGLAEYCRANVCVFVLSDVMGNDMSVIGSGPFCPPRRKTTIFTALSGNII